MTETETPRCGGCEIRSGMWLGSQQRAPTPHLLLSEGGGLGRLPGKKTTLMSGRKRKWSLCQSGLSSPTPPSTWQRTAPQVCTSALHELSGSGLCGRKSGVPLPLHIGLPHASAGNPATQARAVRNNFRWDPHLTSHEDQPFHGGRGGPLPNSEPST